MGASLDTLPFDVILRIFYYLSTHDIIRTCQACKHLRANLDEHHIWLELAKKRCSKNASVARHILPLTARSTDELRAFVVGQARLDRYWVEQTVLTNPLPRFRSSGSAPTIFCELLPGGEYLILAHRDGNISLLSLVDLDNIHEISRFSISSPIGADVDTVSLATDHKGHPLLVVSMHGSPRRLICTTLDIETRSINLVKFFEIEMSVLAVAIQHNIVACLCQHGEPNTFSFLIATVDDTVDRVLRISRIPADPAALYLYDICLPSPTTLFLFEASNIRCYHIPDVSELSPGDHHLPELSTTWSWQSLTLPIARLKPTSMHWEPGLTTPTVVTFLCDFLSHTVTLRPSEKSGSSYLDVIDHFYIRVFRPVSTPYQGTTILKSQKGIWFRLETTPQRSYDFAPFSTYDVRRTGLVRLDISKMEMREHLVPAVNFDEVSGRIIVLVRTLEGDSYMDHGFVIDMA